jgi:endonuclease I
MNLKQIGLFFMLLWGGVSLSAQIPENYYSSAYGKSGEALRTALFQIIKNHTERSYAQLWTDFRTTDAMPDNPNKVWDVYSNCDFTFGTNQCGNYSSECDCYNREHSFPKSWFNDAAPMYTDLFHLYPTDGWVNGKRSNFPFGEVGNATYTSGNGSKLGNCDFSGFSGTVFEPIDEYKGDFARTYFYMSTCYSNKRLDYEHGADMFNGARLKSWALNLLIKWHNQDPVSEKELNRNNAIYGIQGNRNPFIDYPELVGKIWGADSVNTFSIGVSTIEPVTVRCYPNPATTTLTIETDHFPTNMSIVDPVGKTVLPSRSLCQSKTIIDISMLPTGIYFVKIKTINNYKIIKFIILQH